MKPGQVTGLSINKSWANRAPIALQDMIMKKVVNKQTVQEPKEETPELLNYKKDLEEIKDLLKVIAEKLIDVRGGF